MSFKVVSWTANDDITVQKLSDMVANDADLNKRMPGIRLKNGSIDLQSGISMLAGTGTISSRKGLNGSIRVNWQGQFSAGCKPLVLTGAISNYERYVFVTVQGPSAVRPDDSGCTIVAYVDKDENRGNKKNIDKTFYVDYLAIGY